MHKTYENAIAGLDKVDCEVYAIRLVKMLAALQEAVDECVSREVGRQIADRFLALCKALEKNGVS